MISIIIPVYNEKDSLAILHGEIERTARQQRLEYEVVFVDDGSSDGSWDVIADLAKRSTQVHGIRFRRNFGKAAALSAGFAAAHGDIIMTLDADLQDDPAEIPRFLAALAEGKDVVSGWKKMRHDPWHKVWPSRVFNAMVSWLTGRAAARSQLRHEVLSRRGVARNPALRRAAPLHSRAGRRPRLQGRRDRHPASPAPLRPIQVRRRRFIKGFLDLLTVKFLTGFGQRPQHLLGSIGLVQLPGRAVLAWRILRSPGSFATGSMPISSPRPCTIGRC